MVGYANITSRVFYKAATCYRRSESLINYQSYYRRDSIISLATDSTLLHDPEDKYHS